MSGGIQPFSFSTAGKILFGSGQSKHAANLITAFGSTVMVVHGASHMRVEWLLNDVLERGGDVSCLSCPDEPSLMLLETAVDVARAIQPDVVVSVGGGSAIDLGKAVAALTPAMGQAIEYLEVIGAGKKLDNQPLPFVAIPTTAGTGAEVTKNAVISVLQKKRKVSLRDERMMADIAIIDPRLTDGLPRNITLSAGLDAITQVVEPYISCKATPFSDALCKPAIPRGLAALKRLMEGEDAAARDEIAWVSLCSGLALANSGLGAVHGFAGVIGGHCGAPHGAICGALLPHVLRSNAKASVDQPHYAGRISEVCESVAEFTGAQDSDVALKMFEEWIHQNGLSRLSDMGVQTGDHGEIVEAAQASSSMKGNPVALSNEALLGVLASAG